MPEEISNEKELEFIVDEAYEIANKDVDYSSKKIIKNFAIGFGVIALSHIFDYWIVDDLLFYG